MRKLPAETGLILVLLLLAAAFSFATLSEQRLTGFAAGEAVAETAASELPANAVIYIVAGSGQENVAFADAAEETLKKSGRSGWVSFKGPPPGAKKYLAALKPPDAILVSPAASRWTMWEKMEPKPKLFAPQSQYWPRFLTADNLLNVANQVAVMAILAAGMTLILITGHVDLSVGSLIALASVTGTLIIQQNGAEKATTVVMILGSLAAILVCGLIGAASGALAVRFALPSFLITLGVMKMARGLAYKVSEGESVHKIPDGFVWLGRGADLFGIPNAVVLMALLYLVVHLVLTRTVFGRHVYAVGGNTEAARLAGVRVRTVVVLVFLINGLLAGLGGIVLASQLKSGSPTYGVEYELYVIAAVVVGGTSLTGGQGNVIGTLLGAFLLAVIQNGMNLTGVDSYDQQIVLGAIIIAALLVDRLKKRSHA